VKRKVSTVDQSGGRRRLEYVNDLPLGKGAVGEKCKGKKNSKWPDKKAIEERAMDNVSGNKSSPYELGVQGRGGRKGEILLLNWCSDCIDMD